MTSLAITGALSLALLGAAPFLGALAGVDRRPSVSASGGRLGADTLRAAAAFAALALAVGGLSGDVLVIGALGAAALGRRRPAAALTFVVLGAVAALRVGSSATDDVAGAHAVLGPALTSPVPGVAIAAGLAAVAAIITAAALVPQLPRGAGVTVLTPGAAADAVLPGIAGLLAVIVVAGPPVVAGEPASWAMLRIVALAGGLGLAALARRFGRSLPPDRLLSVAAAASVGAVAVALASA